MSGTTNDNLKIGIICAGDDELAPFLPHIENVKVSERAMLKIYEGTLAGIDAKLDIFNRIPICLLFHIKRYGNSA